MRKTKKILTLFLILISVTLLLSPSASALNWNGNAVVGVGASNAQGRTGYTIRLIGSDGCFGYRFSVVDASGATKTKSGYPSAVDVYRDLTLDSTLNYVYKNYKSASTKYNKKQLITNRNSVSLNMTAIKDQNNSCLASTMGFATTLPAPTGIGTWQANNNNLNKVLAKLGINGVSNFVYGDRLLVEPLFVMQMNGGGYNALTITEIALYGAAFYGDSSSTGGASSSSGTWGYIANYTNMYFPRALYTGDTNMLGNLWSVGSNLASKTSFENIITKGYGVGIAYSNFTKVKVTLNKGKGISSVSGAGTYKVGESVSINATLNDGYMWNKWTGSKASSVKNYTFTMPSSDVTNTANATPITYTITHNPNGGGWAGDTDVDSRDYTIENSVDILTAPTRNGYSFNGWKVTNASGNWTSGKVYTVSGSAISLSGMYGNVTLTAQWTENKHTLKTTFYYMTSSGTATSSDRSSTVGVLTSSVTVTPPIPSSTVTKSGRTYTFSHWSTTNSASGAKTTSYTASTDNQNYYAVYTSTVRITYNGNENTGGSTSATTGTNKYNYNASSSTGVTLTVASNGFTKTGHSFQYWTVEKNAEAGYAVGTKLPLYSDLLLYAKWKPDTYTISYNKNTTTTVENMPSTGTKTYGVNYNIPNKTPMRTGYVFDHWETSTTSSTSNWWFKYGYTYNSSSTPKKSPYLAANNNYTFYAQWNPISYSVKFNGNGSTSGSMSNQSHTYDAAKALTANAFKRAFVVTFNYNGNGASNTTATAAATFNGWATSASGSKVYNDKQSVKNLASTSGATVNLYAKWTDASVTLPTPTRTGYTFNGWYSAASDGTKIGNGGATYNPTANITLYARWSPIIYTVKFNGNGATSGTMSNQSHTYDTAKALTANSFKRVFVTTFNYNGNGASNTTATAAATFNGWATSASGSKVYNDKQSVKNLASMSGATVNLYAKWTDASVTLPTPTRTGYTFNGWYSAASGGSKIGNGGATYKPTANTTLYARWSPITYTVKFNGNGATSGTMSNQSHTYDVAKALTANSFKRAFVVTFNYNGNGSSNTTAIAAATFSGWATSASGSKVYNDKQSVKNLTTTSGATVNLYAKWTDGSVTLPTPTRTGYSFSGWYTAASGGTKIGNGGATYKPTANTTLYARWSPITYTVKFNGNGATSGTMSNQSHTYDVAKALTANSFKRAFVVTFNYNRNGASNTTATAAATFNGWSTSASGSKVYNDKQSVKNLASTQGATVNLYAKWTDGSVTLPAPTRTGYSFSGWYTAESGGTKIGNGGATYKPTANITLYARWSPITYTVKFNGNGATSGTMSNQSHTYDTAKALTANSFRRAFVVTFNYNGNGVSNTTTTATATFSGWATSASGSKAYNDKQSVKNLATIQGATVNLYAKWADASVTLPSPTRIGYSFSGWYTAASGGTKIGNGGAAYKPTANITLYARWSPITYSIKFNGNNATSGSMANMAMTYDVAKNLADNAFKRSGYSFTGWNAKADGGGTKYTNKQSVKNLTTINGDVINLYAQWTPDSYTIKFNGNGATSGEMADLNMTYDVAKNLTANAFKKTGYAFKNWNTKPDGSGSSYADKQSVKNLPVSSGNTITMYAQWSPISYSVRYNGNGATSGTMNDQKMMYDTAVNLIANSFKREFTVTFNYNYAGTENTTTRATASFGGWAKSATGNKAYNDKQSVKNLTSTANATVNLYAKWTDGTVILSTPTRTGYTFDGWYTTATGGTRIGTGGGSYTPGSNVMVYAHWTPINYTIRFNGNGATTGSMANQSMTYDVAKNLTANAYKREFTVIYNYNYTGTTDTTEIAAASFNGWAKSAAGNKAYNDKQSVKNLTSTASGTVNLYAKWTDGTVILPSLTRTGYTFDGWYTTSTGSTRIGTGGGSYTPSSNVTVYAHWTPINYTIRFNGNGSTTGSMENQSMTYDVAKNLTANAYKREFTVTYNYNYTGTTNIMVKATAAFNGWAKSAAGNKVYADKHSVKNLTTTANATVNLYAKWTDGTVILPSPTRTGYIFDGWYTSMTGGTRIGTGGGSYTPSGNVTVYAHWTPISYTIRFNGNGSTSGSMADLSMTYDTAKNLTANAFVKTGAEFVKWNTKSDGSGTDYSDRQAVKNLTSVNGKVINLYAQWRSLRELSIEAISPNAAYRESTDVITSFNLVNSGSAACLPADSVSVVFKVFKDTSEIKTVTQSNVVVPGNERNLLYFKWSVPTNLGNSKIYVSAEIVENGDSYGLIKNQYATVKYNVYSTPDTQYEASAPDGFVAANTPTETSETAEWSIWAYDEGSFRKINYGMAISDATATITPDESANAEQQSGVLVMKSGYGFGISMNNDIITLSGYTAAPSGAYTKAQYALALFPEFGYAAAQNNCRTLELVSGNWNFRENDDYGRIHFTPLWYPDGPYTVTVQQSDCWTPAGMIARQRNTNTITISGSAYDDWYIG